ncbi:hypothetical protein KW787_00365 [Candidatus Pacearchaeota archaeon]|nr:hypothetical protein [Candidatus Pacearchaeota archaeon]
MVNKRGWLRIVEASLAIVIIFGALVALTRTSKPVIDNSLGERIPVLLDELAQNKDLREQVISYDTNQSEDAQMNKEILNNVNSFIGDRIQASIQHVAIICDPQELCSLSQYPKNAGSVYSYERIISSTLQNFSPKKVKLFLWRAN